MGKIASLFDRSRTSTWFALLMVFVATRSVIEIWTGSDQGDKYLVVGVDGGGHGDLRAAPFRRAAGIARVQDEIPGAVAERGVHGDHPAGRVHLLHQLGRMLVLLALIAIEINLVSIFAEYTGKVQAPRRSD